jgi:NAD(P)H dehydrogenase (quinone)
MRYDMSDELHLITGATGKTGAHTVQILRSQGARVRTLVHHLDERSERLAALGAEVVQGDLLDFHAVSAATAGVTRAYFCYPISPSGLVEATAIFAQAASEAGIQAVVNMSQISARRDAKSHAAHDHWLSERLFDRTAFGVTHLRPTFFAEWLTTQWSRHDDEGVLRLPFGDGRHAPIAAADQARVIAAILTNPASHDRQVYPLTGPVELNHYEIADKISETLGIPVRYEAVDIDTFAAALADQGATPFLIQHLTNVAQDYRDGIFAGANNLVAAITGTAATTVQQFTTANRAAFDQAGRDASWARLRAA